MINVKVSNTLRFGKGQGQVIEYMNAKTVLQLVYASVKLLATRTIQNCNIWRHYIIIVTMISKQDVSIASGTTFKMHGGKTFDKGSTDNYVQFL